MQTSVGGGTTQEIISRMGTELLFGRLSAKDAAKQFGHRADGSPAVVSTLS